MENKSNATYLKITMHDNDFTGSLKYVADILYKIFQYAGRYPEENELPLLATYIQNLWFSIHNINAIMYWNKNSVGFNESNFSLFRPSLKFVDFLDIPEWDDYESVYIPMFDNSAILIR